MLVPILRLFSVKVFLLICILLIYTICLMTDLTPLSQALTLDGSYIHECIWITWKFNKSINQSIKSYRGHKNEIKCRTIKVKEYQEIAEIKQKHINLLNAL